MQEEAGVWDGAGMQEEIGMQEGAGVPDGFGMQEGSGMQAAPGVQEAARCRGSRSQARFLRGPASSRKGKVGARHTPGAPAPLPPRVVPRAEAGTRWGPHSTSSYRRPLPTGSLWGGNSDSVPCLVRHFLWRCHDNRPSDIFMLFASFWGLHHCPL